MKLLLLELYSISILFVTFVSLLYPTSAEPKLSQLPPHFTKKLKNFKELEYGPVNEITLDCSANADPAPHYTWFKNNQKLATDSAGIKFLHQDNSSRLVIDSPGPEHEGYYHCEAENDLGKAKSVVVHVSKNARKVPKESSVPEFVEEPDIKLLTVGSTAEFTCRAKGKPEPSLVWMKNGEIIPGETGQQLVLHNIGRQDVANYACNASNIAGYVYKDVYLTILTVSADIKEGPIDQIVSKGSTVTIKCRTEGYPEPNITWFHDDKKIEEDGLKYKIDRQTGDLVVLAANIDDEGTYKCLASNFDNDTQQGTLTVKSKTEIIDGPKGRTVTVFTSLSFNCTVVSDLSEDLTVIWKKNNVDLKKEVFAQRDRNVENENYSYAIHNVTFDDKGTYTCVAYTESTMSNPAIKSGLLSVSGIPPSLGEIGPLDPIFEGREVVLACNVLAGFRKPALTWFKDDRPVEEGNGLVIEGDSLHIREARQEHSGEYTCKATNQFGSATKEVTLTVRKRMQILSKAVYLEYTEGRNGMIDCTVDVDDSLQDSLGVVWLKDGDRLDLEIDNTEEGDSFYEDDEREVSRLFKHPNNSLEIRSMREEDLGVYECHVSTDLESEKSAPATVYIPSDIPWLIIVLIGLGLLILLLLCFCLFKLRRRKMGKGYYGVKDIEKSGGKHNKSDIYYTTEDGDSIMNEQDNLPLKDSTPVNRTPIFTPKTIRHLANMDKSGGSVGSLLEDDEFLRRGMDEDGSFRERYAD